MSESASKSKQASVIDTLIAERVRHHRKALGLAVERFQFFLGETPITFIALPDQTKASQGNTGEIHRFGGNFDTMHRRCMRDDELNCPNILPQCHGTSTRPRAIAPKPNKTLAASTTLADFASGLGPGGFPNRRFSDSSAVGFLEGPAMGGSWQADLERWLAPFSAALRHKTRARMCPAYVAGLIGPGDRKSIQPMAARDGGVSYDQSPVKNFQAVDFELEPGIGK